MTALEIVDKILSEAGGGKFRDDIKFEPDLLLAELPQYRSRAMIIAFNGSRDTAMSKMINPSWYQEYEFAIDRSTQSSEACYLEAYFPPVVRMDDKVDGATLIGDKESGLSFRKVQTPETASSYLKAGRLNKAKIGYVLFPEKIRIYGNKLLKNLYANCIFQYPTDVPDFNIETDRYPISTDLIPIMAKLWEIDMAQKLGIPLDTLVDRAESIEVRNFKKQ